jgi:hypothetical protein
VAAREVAGGGRQVAVAPQRLEHWLDGFEQRHGDLREEPDGESGLRFCAADGARALCQPAFPPLLRHTRDGLLEHSLRERRIGVLLVRLGGHAAGVFEGATLTVSKVGSRQVHGRSAAGGWSQQRFARRREGQVSTATRAAVEVALRVLLPEAAALDALVTGGDRTALKAVLGDAHLAPLRPLVTSRVLDVADPRLRVLQQSITSACAVHITLHGADLDR